MPNPRVFAAALLTVFAAACSAKAARAVVIDWVAVGNPGNVADAAGYGAVQYEYRIMKYEWTNSEYVAFLNAVDPEGLNAEGIWNSNMNSSTRGGIARVSSNANGFKYTTKPNMGNKPVVFVNWFDAARVANWLQAGAQSYETTAEGSAAVENGAYTLNGRSSGAAAARNPNAVFFIPTENEWYKAAYYSPLLNGHAGGYTAFATGFNTAPTAVTSNAVGDGSAGVGSTANSANRDSQASWNNQDGIVTTVGTNGAASYHGTFDMSGNVQEWNDLDGAELVSRGMRGGDWSSFGSLATDLSSSSRLIRGTTYESSSAGFRLAAPVAVPEPSTCAAGLTVLVCVLASMRRRRKRA